MRCVRWSSRSFPRVVYGGGTTGVEGRAIRVSGMKSSGRRRRTSDIGRRTISLFCSLSRGRLTTRIGARARVWVVGGGGGGRGPFGHENASFFGSDNVFGAGTKTIYHSRRLHRSGPLAVAITRTCRAYTSRRVLWMCVRGEGGGCQRVKPQNAADQST